MSPASAERMEDQLQPADRPWWRDAVIYQIYPRSFADGNGDGIGDLAGIRARLPYVKSLGVDAIWLTPFFPSPQADGGYDVADYRGVDPLFGSLADADALIAEAHALGLRVIVDIVPNHTSDQHPWFQEALAADPGSAARDRYLFRPGTGDDGAQPPNDWPSVFGGPAWQRVTDGEWYLHLFAAEQPDLNWRNPEVREDFLQTLRFWLDRGADGFRIDVAPGQFKDPALPDVGAQREAPLAFEPEKRRNHPYWDLEEVHDLYRDWRRLADEYPGDRTLIGEIWLANDRLARYLRPGELHTAFNIEFLFTPWDAAALRRSIDSCLGALREVGAPPTWVLSNHDVARNVTRYGEGDAVRGRRRARAAALLMLALPGGAYVYQGEELGLPEVEDLPEEVLQDPTWLRSERTVRGRDGCRVPLPWTRGGPSYGFGNGGSWLPQPATWGQLSVQAQEGDPASMLELYRAALRIRRADPALGEGPMRWIDLGPHVLAFKRGGDTGAIICVVNLGSVPVALPEGDVVAASEEVRGGKLSADAAAWVRS